MGRNEAAGTKRSRRWLSRTASWCAWFVAPLAVAALAAAVLVERGHRLDEELQLMVPSVIQGGRSMPARAFVFKDRTVAPELVQVPVHLTLEQDEAVVGDATLQPTAAGDMAATMQLPELRPGAVRVRAQARLASGRVLRVDRQLVVFEGDTALSLQSRRVSPLQHFQQQRLGPAPDRESATLQVRVSGGPCALELPCSVWARELLGRDAIVLQSTEAVRVLDEERWPELGLVRWKMVPERFPAAAVLQIASPSTADEPLRYRVQLPLELSASKLALDAPLLRSEAAPLARVLGDPVGPLVVEAYQGGTWSRTTTLAANFEQGRLPFRPLSQGLWWLQARPRLFTHDGASVHPVFVAGGGQSPERLVGAVQRAVRAELGESLERPWAGITEGNIEAAIAFTLAAIEDRRIALPPIARSTSDQAPAREAQRKERTAWAVFGVVCSGLLAMGIVIARALRASAQARRIMTSAGDETAGTQKRRWAMVAEVLIVSSVLGLAFAAVVVWMLAAGRM